MNLITVIDPGHGGMAAEGGSSPNRARGPNGLLEKDVALDLARRLGRLLAGSSEVLLTRETDTNLSLSERARRARERNAGVFLSLHFNGSDNAAVDGSEAWIARRAGAGSRALAELLSREISSAAGTPARRVVERDLGVLLPSRHAADTAACLLEVAYLTNPGRAARLENDAYRQTLAEALNRAVRRYFSEGPVPAAAALDAPPRHSPAAWAHEKMAEGLQRFNDFGAEFSRQCGIVFPGVPSQVFMGFALNGNPWEDTISDPSQGFHELGMFGVEGGHRDQPAPGNDVSGNGTQRPSAWLQLAHHPQVQQLLGRPGCTAPGCWRPPHPFHGVPQAIRDQIAIGLVNIRRHFRELATCLRHEHLDNILPSSETSLWFVALSFMGWSAGTGFAVGHLRAVGPQLAAVDEAHRWGEFLRLLVQGGESGSIRAIRAIPRPRGHRQHESPYYSALRTMQKIEAGRLLAEQMHAPLTFFDEGLGARRTAIQEAITHFATSGVPAQPASTAHEAAMDAPVVRACEVPARPADGVSGTAFMQTIMGSGRPANWVQREDAIFAQVQRGNIPQFLRGWKTVNVSFTERSGTRHTGSYRVMPDYLAIGSDQDYVRVPMDAITAQRCADEYCCSLPTAKMVHDIYRQADVKLEARPRDDWRYRDGRQQSTASYLAHNRTIESQLAGRAPGGLIAGHKKDVVISTLLDQPQFRHLLAFYGFFRSNGTPWQAGPGGGASVAHEPSYADYSHGVRLVHPMMTVDGQPRQVVSVLQDPVLYRLLTDEGVMPHPRIMAARATARAGALQSTTAVCAGDVAVTDTMALLVSRHAPLPVTAAEVRRTSGASFSGAHDDYKSVCAVVPAAPDERALIFFHGNNNYVTVAASGDVPARGDPGGHSRVPRWADARARNGASGKPAAAIHYHFDSLDVGQNALAPASSFDGLALKHPVVLVPEDVELAAGNFWAVPPRGQYGTANDGRPAGPGTPRFGELVTDCYEKLRCLSNPSGHNYLDPRMDSRASWVGNVRRFYISGHSGGGKPLVEAAGADMLLVTPSSAMGAGGRAADVWLFDCTYGFGTHNYVNFIVNWHNAGHLAYAPDGARFVCVYGPRSPQSDTETEADRLRGEIAGALRVTPASLLKLHDSPNMSSPTMTRDVIPALRSSPVVFIRTGVPHDSIPAKFTPLLLRTAAS